MNTHSFHQTGRYHREIGQECQDMSLFYENDSYCLAVIADGVTACPHSREGARLVCAAVRDYLQLEGENLFLYENKKLAYLVTEHILFFLEQAAMANGRPVEDYASTVAFACVEKQTGCARLVHLGDGAILQCAGDIWSNVAAPRQYGGRPCVTTTDQAFRSVQLHNTRLQEDDALLLCTDGFLHAMRTHTPIRNALKERDFHRLDRLMEASGEPDDSGYILLTRACR